MRNICTQPSMAVRGVRSSWLTVERNSSLSRLAASASVRAAFSLRKSRSRSVSAFTRSSTTSTTMTSPSTWPSAARSGA